MINDLVRIAIICFSFFSLPFAMKLFVAVWRQEVAEKYQRHTRYVLLALFAISIFTASLSIIISFSSLVGIKSFLASDLSRFRSLFYAIGNFLVCVAFYNVFKRG